MAGGGEDPGADEEGGADPAGAVAGGDEQRGVDPPRVVLGVVDLPATVVADDALGRCAGGDDNRHVVGRLGGTAEPGQRRCGRCGGRQLGAGKADVEVEICGDRFQAIGPGLVLLAASDEGRLLLPLLDLQVAVGNRVIQRQDSHGALQRVVVVEESGGESDLAIETPVSKETPPGPP